MDRSWGTCQWLFNILKPAGRPAVISCMRPTPPNSRQDAAPAAHGQRIQRSESAQTPADPLAGAYGLGQTELPARPRLRVIAWRAASRPQPIPGSWHSIPAAAATHRQVLLRPVLKAWEEHGWRREGRGYVGIYRVGSRCWSGRAVEPARRSPGDRYDFYCYRPPGAMNRNPCWHHIGAGWYWIHFHRPPADLLSGIKNIEESLAHASG